MKINGIDNLNNIFTNEKTSKTGTQNSFGNFLMEALDNVNKSQLESDELKKMLATGEIDNLHDVTIATEKANVSLQITMSIRNKIVEAYREILRMQF